MIRLLRDLAANWADARYVKTNDALRRQIKALDANYRALRKNFTRLVNANKSLGQINLSYQQIIRRVEGERDAALIELEQARVAAKGDGWEDVVNAGLGEPERGQP